MPLTAIQTTAFFEDAAQMAIPNATVIQLQQEGISSVSDLADVDEETMKQIVNNLKKPGGTIPNPHGGPPAHIPTPPFILGAKSFKRLSAACNLVRYYDTINRSLTPGNLQWNQVMKNFDEQWKALQERKGKDARSPDVPAITKALPIINWTESFNDYLHRVIGVRSIPLAYVIRDKVDVIPIQAPQHAANQPYAAIHGSIESELIARALHTHGLYRTDNQAVYYKLEEATRGTSYAASIKPFQRAKDGRNAWLALKNQYAGKDKWEAELKRCDALIHERKWKGQTSYGLERFTQMHRFAYVTMQQCAEHVAYQLPNEHTRVGYLLDNIHSTDAGLQAAMASVRTDDAAGGLRSDFEAAVAHLLPYCPVSRNRAAGNKRDFQVSDARASKQAREADISAFGSKPAIGKSGVHLRFHHDEEYAKLTLNQKRELRRFRDNNPSVQAEYEAAMKNRKKPFASKQRQLKRQKKFEAKVAAAVSEQITAIQQTQDADDTQDVVKQFIMSVVKEAGGKTPNETTLNKILKKVKG